jgi:hypothetical protein
MKNQTTFLLIVFFTLITFYTKAQTTVEFETGFVNNGVFMVMKNHSNTHLSLRRARTSTVSNFMGGDFVLVNKQTLVVDDTLFNWNFVDSTFKGGLVAFYEDSQGNMYYVEFGQTSNNTELILNYYEMNYDYSIGRILTTKTWHNRISQQIGFINDELIIIYSNSIPISDSLYIETYDVSGLMLQTRLYDAFNPNLNQIDITGFAFKEIKKHPQLNKAFVLTNFVGVKLFVVDQNTLDTVRTYNAAEYGGPGNANLLNYDGYYQLYNRHVRMEYDGIVLSGDATTKPYYLSNQDIWTTDNQFYSIKQFWDSTYEIQNFGPIDIYNGACFGYGVNESTQTRVIAGSIPYDDVNWTANEQREVLIYLYDQWGKYDSIYIHGDKNHICTDLIVEDNGDLFISGLYSDAWSTDSVYYWLTKIPGVAVGMIEQEKMNNHLYLFPNPTVEQIQIKEVSKFINGEFEIYSQTGVLVKQGKVTGQEFDVSTFIAGVYILSVKSESGEQFNAIFVKE